MISIEDIKINEDNPRVIKNDRFKKLVKSISEFPKMMELRPLIVNEDGVILGGNMRYKALIELGYKEIPGAWVKRAEDLTEEEKRRFVIADNVSFGEHDWIKLANDWNNDELEGWGLELNIEEAIEELEEDEDFDLPQSVQLEPPKEYILIMADPNSVEWEDLKETLKLKMVRRGGYKKGSAFDSVSLERVINWIEFKKRIDVSSSTK